MASKDYYDWALNELLYKSNLTEEGLKKQYRELSKKYHPDINPEADPEKFKALSRAYDDIKKKKVNIKARTSYKQSDDAWSVTQKEQYKAKIKKSLNLENMSNSDLKDLLFWEENELMSLQNAYTNYKFKRNEVRFNETRCNQQMNGLEQDLGDCKSLIKPTFLKKWVSYACRWFKDLDLPATEFAKSAASSLALIAVVTLSVSQPILTIASIAFIAYSTFQELKNCYYENEASSILFLMEKTGRALEDLKAQELYLNKEVSYYNDKKTKKEIERDLLREELSKRTSKNTYQQTYSWESQTEYGGYQYHK